jgi:cation transport ATPase|tara:strand:+ start:230 stop:622 length:393 start_codon:yes stop_codon:yes gene_type:complete
MKEILKKIFGIDNVASKVGDLVDRFVQSKDEKAQFEKELTQIFIEAEKDMQQNVTERWKSDMGSDSWLSKNVRPLVLLFLIVSTIVMIFIDAGAIKFNVQENWVDLLQIVLITVISAYFGGRSFEKIKKK